MPEFVEKNLTELIIDLNVRNVILTVYLTQV